MPRRNGSRRIEFARQKYGPELLVDVGWIHDFPTFIVTDEPHVLTFFEVLLVTRGSGRLWLDTLPMPVAPARVFFTAPGQVRRWNVRDLDGLCLFFPDEFVTEFFHDARFVQKLHLFARRGDEPMLVLDSEKSSRLLARLEEMRGEIAALRADSPHILRAVLYEMLIWMNRLFPPRCEIPADAPGLKAVRFRELVEQHLTRLHHVAEYAALLGVTAGHLNDLSRRYLGQSAGKTIRGRIITEARRKLLHSEATAAQIAEELGFIDPAYFTRFFKRETGATPTEYRLTIREKYQSFRA